MLRRSGERNMPKRISKLPVMIKLDCSLTNFCSFPPHPAPPTKKTWTFLMSRILRSNKSIMRCSSSDLWDKSSRKSHLNPSSPPAKGLDTSWHLDTPTNQVDLLRSHRKIYLPNDHILAITKPSIKPFHIFQFQFHHQPTGGPGSQVSPTKRDEIGWYEFLGIHATNALLSHIGMGQGNHDYLSTKQDSQNMLESKVKQAEHSLELLRLKTSKVQPKRHLFLWHDTHFRWINQQLTCSETARNPGAQKN